MIPLPVYVFTLSLFSHNILCSSLSFPPLSLPPLAPHCAAAYLLIELLAVHLHVIAFLITSLIGFDVVRCNGIARRPPSQHHRHTLTLTRTRERERRSVGEVDRRPHDAVLKVPGSLRAADVIAVAAVEVLMKMPRPPPLVDDVILLGSLLQEANKVEEVVTVDEAVLALVRPCGE